MSWMHCPYRVQRAFIKHSQILNFIKCMFEWQNAIMMNFGRYVNYQLHYIILLPGVLYMQGLQYIVAVCFKTRILLNNDFVFFSAELYCTVLCCAVLCCAVLCCAVLCYAVLWCIVLYKTIKAMAMIYIDGIQTGNNNYREVMKTDKIIAIYNEWKVVFFRKVLHQSKVRKIKRKTLDQNI